MIFVLFTFGFVISLNKTMKTPRIWYIVWFFSCSLFLYFLFETRIHIDNKEKPIESNENKESMHIVLHNDTYSSSMFQKWLNEWGPVLKTLTTVQRRHGNKIDGNIWNHDNSVFFRLPQLEAYFTHIQNHKKDIQRICETGFNGGHSALMWAALYNGDIDIVSFDMCVDQRCEVGKKHIERIYPNIRLTVVKGDSTKTIPLFYEANPSLKCNFISIDGGHSGNVPSLDIYNFHALADVVHSIVIDDADATSSEICLRTPGKAWEKAIQNNLVCPLEECKFCYVNPRLHTTCKFCFGSYCPTTKV